MKERQERKEMKVTLKIREEWGRERRLYLKDRERQIECKQKRREKDRKIDRKRERQREEKREKEKIEKEIEKR